MHTGKKIKMLRALKGITQDELAEKINKTRALVSHIEQTGKINHYTLLAVAKALDVSEKDIEHFDGKMMFVKEESSASEYGKSPMELLKKELENYQKENDILRELVKSQRKIIEMLEKKNKK